MNRSPRPLTRATSAVLLTGALTISGLIGLASPAAAQQRDTKVQEPMTFVMVERATPRFGFAVESTDHKADQQYCDSTPVPDDIVECDIDELAWTCVNGDTDPTDGGCIGNADKPSVFPQD